MKLYTILIPLMLLGVAGCQTTSSDKINTPAVNVPLSVPLSANFKNEIAIARYNELLSKSDMSPEQKAQLYYNRGMLFDSVGLSTLARIDFNRAAKLKPDLAEVYNFLGIHQTLDQNYGPAYEMFDSVLELDEKHEYAYLNRGIALYYGDKFQLASEDLNAFLERAPDDAYRMLWLYLAESKIDEVNAKLTLKQHRMKLSSDSWSTQLVDLYLGDLSEEQFLAQLEQGITNQQEYAQRLCEAYFYLAKQYQAKGAQEQAIIYFKLTLATNVYEFVEHKYARLELDLIADSYREQS